MSKENRKRGRPPVDSELLRARVERDMLDGIDRFIADEPDAPSRPEAIRRILKDWLIGHRYLPLDQD